MKVKNISFDYDSVVRFLLIKSPFKKYDIEDNDLYHFTEGKTFIRTSKAVFNKIPFLLGYYEVVGREGNSYLSLRGKEHTEEYLIEITQVLDLEDKPYTLSLRNVITQEIYLSLIQATQAGE